MLTWEIFVSFSQCWKRIKDKLSTALNENKQTMNLIFDPHEEIIVGRLHTDEGTMIHNCY